MSSSTPLAPAVRRALALPSLAMLSLTACAARRDYEGSIVTDRPDFTESAVVVPRGAVQAEGGHTYERAAGERTHTTGEVLLRVSLGPRVEARIAPNSYVTSVVGGVRTAGIEDASLGLKLQLGPERDGRHALPTTSLILSTDVPTGSAALRGDGLQPEAKLLLGWTLADGWSLGSNLNVASLAEPGRRRTEGAASVTVGHELSQRLGSYVEWFGTRPDVGRASHFANGGLTWLLSPDQQLDVRAGVALAEWKRRFVGVGMSQRW